MATQTLEFNATTGLTITCKLFAIGSDTVVASVAATEKTNDKNRYSVAFTNIPAGRYRLNGFVGSVGGFVNETYNLLLITAVFLPESESSSAIYPPVERDTADDRAIEFDWIAGATFAGGDSTRIFPGQAANQAASISGAITLVRSGRYSIAYNIADRALDGTTVVPTEVIYTIVDDNGNRGTLTLVIVAVGSGGASGGTTFDRSPVTATGRLRQIVIGDDYLAANDRSFIWTVPEVSGFTVGDVVAKFGAKATLPCGDYSFLVEGGAEDNGDGTWEVSVDLPRSATYGLLAPGSYNWSMVLEHSGVVITKIQNLTDAEKVKVVASPV